MNKIYKSISFILLSFIIISSVFAQSPERKDVPDKHKWNLADIYPSTSAWQADVDMLKTEVEKLAGFKGTLGKSAADLYTALKTSSDLVKTLSKAWTYASNLSNENLNISENQAMMQQLVSDLYAFGRTNVSIKPLLDSIGAKPVNP